MANETRLPQWRYERILEAMGAAWASCSEGFPLSAVGGAWDRYCEARGGIVWHRAAALAMGEVR